MRLKKKRWTGIGRRLASGGAASSIGLPPRNLGSTQAPRRIARKVFSAIREDSTATSTAELPIPSTSTRLPTSTSGSR